VRVAENRVFDQSALRAIEGQPLSVVAVTDDILDVEVAHAAPAKAHAVTARLAEGEPEDAKVGTADTLERVSFFRVVVQLCPK